MDREESNSKEKKEDGDILEAYSASPPSSESIPKAEYTMQERLVAKAFSIGGQNDQVSRSRQVIQRSIKTNSNVTLGQLRLAPQLPTYRHTLRSKKKKEVQRIDRLEELACILAK